MSYSRIKRGRMAADVIEQGFTQISNELFRDSRISGLAMGVFGHISTHRDGYGVTPESIARSMKNGVSAIKVALRELETYGYLTRTRTRNEDGTLGPSIYKITDMPGGLSITAEAPYAVRKPRSEPGDEIQPQGVTSGNEHLPRSGPAVEKPPVDIPPVVNHPTQNTRGKKTVLEEDQNLSSSPRPRAEQLLLDLGATEAEMTRVLDRIKTEHKPRNLSAYVSRMADTGDLAGMLAELRSTPLGLQPRPAAPPKCDACNPYRRMEDDDGRDVGPCPTCHPSNSEPAKEAPRTVRIHGERPHDEAVVDRAFDGKGAWRPDNARAGAA